MTATPAETDAARIGELMLINLFASESPAAPQALESVAAAIDEADGPLTIGERMLMRELLARLADES